jgi:hypothetical protein
MFFLGRRMALTIVLESGWVLVEKSGWKKNESWERRIMSQAVLGGKGFRRGENCCSPHTHRCFGKSRAKPNLVVGIGLSTLCHVTLSEIQL